MENRIQWQIDRAAMDDDVHQGLHHCYHNILLLGACYAATRAAPVIAQRRPLDRARGRRLRWKFARCPGQGRGLVMHLYV